MTPRQFANDLLGAHAFERGDAVSLHRPLEVHVQLASGCNLDCYMCHEHLRPEGTRHGRGMQFLDERILESIERDVMPYSTSLHLGVGGEPMLFPGFVDLVERAHAANQRIHLTTNGTRISAGRVAEVLARCVSTVEVSVDGATAETYERVRGGASFARLVQNIGLLNRQRMVHEPGERARLTLCMVLMRSNTHELPLMIDLAERLGADSVAAWPVIPVTPEGRADLFDAVSAQPFIDEARARATRSGIALDLPFESRTGHAREPANTRSNALEQLGDFEQHAARTAVSGARPRHFCHMPTLALYVLWDGRVYPCANPEAHQGTALGNLSRESFAEIWNGRAFRNLRAGLQSGDAPDVCRRCPILHRTAGPMPESGSDLVTWFGDRDLVPHDPRTAQDGVIDRAVASGLAEAALKRVDEQLRYARTLEESVRLSERDQERDRHAHASARLHVEELDSEKRRLRDHATNLDTELGHVTRYARSLEAKLREIECDEQRLQHEIAAASLASASAADEHVQLERHAATLQTDLGRLSLHAATLAEERAHLSRHAVTLESERWHLARHARALEEEREHLVRHAANLERILARIHGRRLYAVLARIKDLFVAPRTRPDAEYVPPWVAQGARKSDEPAARSAAEPPRTRGEDPPPN